MRMLVAGLHDEQQKRFLEHTLGGELHDFAFDQAATGVSDGGLGYRRAKSLAPLAFVASRVEARPFVAKLFDDMLASAIGNRRSWLHGTI